MTVPELSVASHLCLPWHVPKLCVRIIVAEHRLYSLVSDCVSVPQYCNLLY